MKAITMMAALGLSSMPLGAQVVPNAPPQGGRAGNQPPNPQGPAYVSPLYQEYRDGNQQIRAQQPQPPQGDPFMRFLFPPDMVMQHQREIGLQDAQRTKLVKEMSTAQATFTEIQWTLSGEQDKLQQLVQGTSIDEAAVQKQLDRILQMENRLKGTQLLMMVRVKNILTPEQQTMLANFRPPVCKPPQGQGGRVGDANGQGRGPIQNGARGANQGQGQPMPVVPCVPGRGPGGEGPAGWR